ncbi:hypothetical protein ACQEVF_27545 [Nonomuraea polychroma]|uniref:hypothetical protein n=1 Tax=Nonomuraea polychroma TaxID=46176 RepID=UPI003D8DC4BC
MVLVTVGTVAVLWWFGGSVSDLVLFGAYLGLGVALPGVLLIRVLYPGIRTVAEEIALGLALGYAVEVMVYIAVRAAGVPLLVLAWPIVTYLVFLAVPRLRRRWRSPARARTPIWWSWSLALLFALLVAWSAGTFFRGAALALSPMVIRDTDVPFHLALIGELKHHVLPTVPWIAGEPLYYHWFVYAHLAASSWITGIEPLVLLCRLAMLPMLAAFLIVVAMTGYRVTGSRPAALVITAGMIFVGAPSLFVGQNPYPFAWGGLLQSSWNSPTQTFAGLLFAPVVLLLLDIFHRRQSASRWVLLGIFLVAVMGAKAVYLPMLAVGLAAVAVVEMVRRRRLPWPVLTALGMTAACLLFSQLVLFGGVRNGMTFYPLWTMRWTWGYLTGHVPTASPPLDSLLGVTLLYSLCWLIALCGILGLLSRPRSLVRSDVVLMLGIGAAGFVPVFLFGHTGGSQFFFLFGSYPYLVAVAVFGILILLRRARVSSRATVVAVGAGVLATSLIPALCGVGVPLAAGVPESLVYRPYVVLLLIVVLAAVVLAATMGMIRTWALMTVALSAIGLPARWHAIVGVTTVKGIDGVFPPIVPATNEKIPPGILNAARWLRDHTDPNDVVATNRHCAWGLENPCYSQQFWLSALSERRVLLEGWASAPTRRPMVSIPDQRFLYLPFWDKERFKANDAVFDVPSVASAQRLYEQYGVRWLVVDERLNPDVALGKFASHLFRSDGYSIYRMRDSSHS